MIPNTILSAKISILLLSLCSWCAGFVCRIEWPRPINGWINKGFANIFGINVDEASHAPEFYPSLNAFFTRTLKPNARPLESEMISPSDGTLTVSMPTELKPIAFQVKNVPYNLNEITHTQPEEFTPAWYACIYLSPKDYHRVHVPVGGSLKHIVHRPGALWPVNAPAVKWIPNLFTRNERLIFEISDPVSKGRYFLVMVGALNVGKITTPFWPEFATQSTVSLNPTASHLSLDTPINLEVGQEISTFHLGSTVVLVGDERFYNHYSPRPIENPQSIKLGNTLK